MAKASQIESIFERLEKINAKAAFNCVDETKAGIGAVLRLLNDARETVTAGNIGRQHCKGCGSVKENGGKRTDHKGAGQCGRPYHGGSADRTGRG